MILWVAAVVAQKIDVEYESLCLGFLKDPVEGEVCEPVVDVAAADVRVHSGEPALLERLRSEAGACQISGRKSYRASSIASACRALPNASVGAIADVEVLPGCEAGAS